MSVMVFVQRHDWVYGQGVYSPHLYFCSRCRAGYFGNLTHWLGECPGPPSIEQRDAQFRTLIEQSAKAHRPGAGEGETPQ